MALYANLQTPVGFRITVGTTPTPIIGPDLCDDAITVYLYNIDATTDVDLGNAAITTGNGYKLVHGTQLPTPFGMRPSDVLYGITATGTAIISVLIFRS